MNKQSTYVARLNHYLKRNILLYDPIWCNKPLTQTKRSKEPSAPGKKKQSTYATHLKNKGIGWLAALQLSSIFFSHFEAEKCSKPCVFHIFQTRRNAKVARVPGGKRARGQESKSARGQERQGREDVKMWRKWDDEKIWKWENVTMRRWEDVKKVWRWEAVMIKRCE